jgi:hypothetical protein
MRANKREIADVTGQHSVLWGTTTKITIWARDPIVGERNLAEN